MRDVVVLARDHAAQAREVAFGLIGACTIPAVGLAVVDPVRVVGSFQFVPMRAFVSVQLGSERHTLADDRGTIGLAA